MLTLRAIPVAALALAAPIRASVAQTIAREYRAPAGFDIRDVAEGGRYVTLDNGTTWEVEISDRATTAAWEPGAFVAIRPISAPRGGYDWLLTKTENVEWPAAVKLVGRQPRTAEP
jgi:hypothetical protein